MAPRAPRTAASRRGWSLAALPVVLATIAGPPADATPATAAVSTTAAPAAAATAGASTPTQDRTTASPATASPQSVAQTQVSTAYRAYELAREDIVRIGEQHDRLVAAADQAEAHAAALRAEVSHEQGGTFIQVLAGFVGDGESDLDRAAQAAQDAAHARGLADMTATALTDAITAAEKARARWEVARAEARQVEARWSARQVADAAIRRSRFSPDYDVEDRKQHARNGEALRAWHAYLDDLAEVGVVPPPAKKLVNPDRLPTGLSRLRDPHGAVTPGLAEADPSTREQRRAPVTVIPAETVRAVSEAFRRVGLPDIPGAIDPSTYACGGFLANAWGPTTLALPADSVNQWRELRTVPRHALQIGDAVVLGSRRTGLEQSGVYVGNGRFILADPTTGTAGVRPLPRKGVFGVKRVPLPSPTTYAAPPAGACGAEPAPAAPAPAPATGDPLVLPVAAGTYGISSTFGDTGALWASGEHTGLDFAAPEGTPVVAMADGVVSTDNPAWAGNLVRIDHGGGVESSYAHLSRIDVKPGQSVARGELIGAVGSRGNSTGPHLHLEVRLDGLAVDPALVLDVPELPRPAYPNGEVPADALCSATPGGGHLLRCDAAVTFRMMSAAYQSATGTAMCLTDSYRSRTDQVALYGTKPSLAAAPGTSVHGFGLAVDLCGGVERFGTAEHAWVVTNGPRYGWSHPSWAAAGGSRPEPWHFEHTA